jgi:hypothetical protein
MATQKKVDELRVAINTLITVDKDKLLRKNLGEESLEQPLVPIIEELTRKSEFALAYALRVHDGAVNSLKDLFTAIAAEFQQQSARNNTEYIQNKATFLNNVKAHVENIQAFWPPFVSAAVEQRGFLQDEGIKKEYQDTINRMQNEATVTLKKVQEESKVAIDEARKLADEIETRARRTAAKISVQAAQTQFKKAQTPLAILLAIWAVLSIGSLIGLGVLMHEFMTVKLPDQWSWQIAYYSALRITALGAVGSFSAYCLKIFKSQLHMFQHNQHRQRVTNCIEGFVESAVTPEQRDLILAQLIDEVSQFGRSGLLQIDGPDGMGSKLTIDNITRAISPPLRDAQK